MKICLLDASGLSAAILKAKRPLADLGAVVAMVAHGFDRCVLAMEPSDTPRELSEAIEGKGYECAWPMTNDEGWRPRAVDVLASAAAWLRADADGDGTQGRVTRLRIVSPTLALARYHDPAAGVELVRTILHERGAWGWRPHDTVSFTAKHGPIETLADVAVLVAIGDEDKRARRLAKSVLGEGAAVKLVREHGSALRVWEELDRGVKMPGFPGLAKLLHAVTREEMARRLAEATPRVDVEVGALLRLGGERDDERGSAGKARGADEGAGRGAGQGDEDLAEGARRGLAFAHDLLSLVPPQEPPPQPTRDL